MQEVGSHRQHHEQWRFWRSDRGKQQPNEGVVLLVEQKLTIALEISERCYVMGHGQVVFEGSPAQLRANAEIRKEWLEV